MDRVRYEKLTFIWFCIIFGIMGLRALWMVFGG